MANIFGNIKWFFRRLFFGYNDYDILEEILWDVEEAVYGTDEDKAFDSGADCDGFKKSGAGRRTDLNFLGNLYKVCGIKP